MEKLSNFLIAPSAVLSEVIEAIDRALLHLENLDDLRIPLGRPAIGWCRSAHNALLSSAL